ncbi:NPCBM/NEW2 domain-containing protein [Maribacter sp. 2210JD10-5]|uniref:NPCBM/NEW2 domain-containing protein n=1 Tax=Maribacter sp. 2210JD10-5 TaxID=3386272 RepID=UPI0039BC6A48
MNPNRFSWLSLLFLIGFNAVLSQEIYLSDIPFANEWNEASEQGKFKSRMNKNFNGGPIKLLGIDYQKGIGTHATSRIKYDLDRKYKTFEVLVGIDDVTNGQGAATAYIKLDGEIAYESDLLKGKENPKSIQLDVSGITSLELHTTAKSNDKDANLVNWANPVLTKIHKTIDWQPVGKVELLSKQDGIYEFANKQAHITVEPYRSNAFRIQVRKEALDTNPINDELVMNAKDPDLTYTFTENKMYYALRTDSLSLRIYNNPLRLALYKADGKTLVVEQPIDFLTELGETQKRSYFSMDATGKKDAYFGGGVQYENFNLRGKNIRNWSIYVNQKRTTGEVEVTIPTFFSTGGFGISLLTAYETSFDFGKKKEQILELATTNGNLDYLLFTGTLKDQVKTYFETTGYPAILPKHAYGLSFRGYGAGGNYGDNTWNAEQYNTYVEEFKKRGVPFESIGTEPGWSTDFAGFNWWNKQFPDPKTWVENMMRKGHPVDLWIHTDVNEKDKEIHNIMKPYLNLNHYPDVSSEKAMDLLFDFFDEEHFSLGVTGFKEDSHVQRIQYYDKWATGATGKEMHNAYWLLWLKHMTNRYISKYEKRPLNLLASGYTGIQRYPFINYADYGNLEGATRAMINSGWFGINYSSEIQGFYNKEQPKYVRAVQLVQMGPTPIHNEWAGGELPWKRPDETFTIYKNMNNLHYKLIPYIYSYAGNIKSDILPLIRPLPLIYEKDEKTYEIDDQYLFGKEILVAPITDHHKAEASRKVYFPKGDDWIDMKTKAEHQGGSTINTTSSLDEMPLFIRSGAIIPMMPKARKLSEATMDSLEIHIYPHKKNSFALYEDNGTDYGFQEGRYALTNISYYETKKELTLNIEKKGGSYKGIPKSRIFRFKIYMDIPKKIMHGKRTLPIDYKNGCLTLDRIFEDKPIEIKVIY